MHYQNSNATATVVQQQQWQPMAGGYQQHVGSPVLSSVTGAYDSVLNDTAEYTVQSEQPTTSDDSLYYMEKEEDR